MWLEVYYESETRLCICVCVCVGHSSVTHHRAGRDTDAHTCHMCVCYVCVCAYIRVCTQASALSRITELEETLMRKAAESAESMASAKQTWAEERAAMQAQHR